MHPIVAYRGINLRLDALNARPAAGVGRWRSSVSSGGSCESCSGGGGNGGVPCTGVVSSVTIGEYGSSSIESVSRSGVVAVLLVTGKKAATKCDY